MFWEKNTWIFTIFILLKQRVHKNSNFTLVLFKMAENVKEINEHGTTFFCFSTINDADCN